MGTKTEFETETGSSTPKLSLTLFPAKVKEPSGMITPPIHTSVSIPFQWEEVPGKPRPCLTTMTETSTGLKPKSARCLELPPRLLADQAKDANMSSPTTVLDGPDVSRLVSNTLSFRKAGSFRSFRKAGRVVQGSFDLSSAPVVNGGGGGGDGGSEEVKNKTVRRKGSFLSLYQNKSHNVLASIYEGFKHVVPWRRGQEKIMKN